MPTAVTTISTYKALTTQIKPLVEGVAKVKLIARIPAASTIISAAATLTILDQRLRIALAKIRLSAATAMNEATTRPRTLQALNAQIKPPA